MRRPDLLRTGVEISVAVPVFNEDQALPELHSRITAALTALDRSYEVVYVDDGSRDRSFLVLTALAETDPSVKVVRFRRNFGQTAALQAGIDYSCGDYLIFMDADLQNDPADIGLLVSKLDEGYDVVSGWRRDRKDPFFSKRLPSRFANLLISKVTGVVLKDYGCTLKGYRRAVLSDLRLYGEMHRFIPALAAWSGALITEVAVQHHPRKHGRSNYGISRTLRVLLDLVTVKFLSSYSTKPIYLFGTVGLLLWVGAFLAGVEVLLEKILPPHTYAHRNPFLLLAVFMGILGVQLVMMGLLAEVMIRTYHEAQDKATFVVRQVIDGRVDPGSTRGRSTAAGTSR